MFLSHRCWLPADSGQSYLRTPLDNQAVSTLLFIPLDFPLIVDVCGQRHVWVCKKPGDNLEEELAVSFHSGVLTQITRLSSKDFLHSEPSQWPLFIEVGSRVAKSDFEFLIFLPPPPER